MCRVLQGQIVQHLHDWPIIHWVLATQEVRLHKMCSIKYYGLTNPRGQYHHIVRVISDNTDAVSRWKQYKIPKAWIFYWEMDLDSVPEGAPAINGRWQYKRGWVSSMIKMLSRPPELNWGHLRAQQELELMGRQVRGCWEESACPAQSVWTRSKRPKAVALALKTNGAPWLADAALTKLVVIRIAPLVESDRMLMVVMKEGLDQGFTTYNGCIVSADRDIMIMIEVGILDAPVRHVYTCSSEYGSWSQARRQTDFLQ